MLVETPATDQDGHDVTLTVTNPGDLPGGSFTVYQPTQKLWIDLEPGFVGTFPVMLTAGDGIGVSDPQTFHVTVEAPVEEPVQPNHPPVLAPIDDQVVEFGTKKINVDVPASDADGDHLKYGVAVDVDPELVEATVLGAPFQEMVLDIADGYSGTFPVTVTVHDGHSESQQTFHVTVSPNRPPVLAPIADMSVPAGTSYVLVETPATDQDGHDVTLTVTNPGDLPGGSFTVYQPTQKLWIDLEPGFVGTFPVMLTAGDGIGVSDPQTFHVTVEAPVEEPVQPNHPPVLAPIDDQVVEFGTKKINVDVPASDADGDHLKYGVAVDVDPELVEATVLGAPFQEMVLDIADGYSGTFPVTVTVHDGHSESQQTFHVTVSPNRPPVLAPIADMSVPAGTSYVLVETPATDQDGHDVTLTVTNPGDLPGGSFTVYQPTQKLWIDLEPGFVGTFPVMLTAGDGIGVSDPQTFHVTVEAPVEEPVQPNHPPVLAPIDDQVVEFGTKKINVDVPASDADGDHLKYGVAVDVDPELVEATVLGAPFQEMVLDIADGYSGTFPVTVTVHDGHSESQQTFHVTVSPNRPPVLAPIADVVVPWTKFSQQSLEVELELDDPDSDWFWLEFEVTTPQLGDGVRAAYLDPNYGEHWLVCLTIDTGYVGSFPVTVTVTDGFDTVQQTFTVLVTNGTPTLAEIPDQTASRRTEHSLPIEVADPDGDLVKVSATIDDPAVDGEFIAKGRLEDSGHYVWESLELDMRDDSYVGSFPVTVAVTDGSATSHQTFTMTIVNAEPTLKPIEDKAIGINETLQLVMDDYAFDEDHDPLSFEVSVDPGFATVEIDTFSRLVLTPRAYGSFPVTVGVTDGAATVQQSFNVDVVNFAPTFEPLEGTTIETNDTYEVRLSELVSDRDFDFLSYGVHVDPHFANGRD